MPKSYPLPAPNGGVPRQDPRLAKLLRQASDLREAGRLADTLRPMLRAARLSPGDAHIQHDLGVTHLHLGQLEAALRHFDRAVTLAPEFGAAHFRRGVVLQSLGREGAIQAYDQAVRLEVADPELFSRAATVLHAEGRSQEAVPLYRHAASLAPGTLGGLLDGAQAALIEDDFDTAETLLQQALARNPEAPEAHAHLGRILSARGEHAAAAVELERAMAQAPDDVRLYYDLVQTRRITPDDGALLARMAAALEVPAVPASRLKLHLARAKAFDDLGDYPAVRAELDAADAIRVAISRFDREGVLAQTQAIVDRFTPVYMAHPGHRGDPSARPLLIVGMPRSGTTLLEQMLASHPAIAGAGEVHFWEAQGQAFLDGAPLGVGADLREVAAAYLARLDRVSTGGRHVVDKMPYNFRWAPLIHLAFPNARILHIRRNPADTCLSILAANLASTRTFSPARRDLLFYYEQYRRLAEHARAVLPAAAWMELDYEDLVTRPEPAIRAVLAFCGVPFDAACLAPERNRRVVVTFSHWQARQPITASSANRWRHHSAWLGEFLAL